MSVPEYGPFRRAPFACGQQKAGLAPEGTRPARKLTKCGLFADAHAAALRAVGGVDPATLDPALPLPVALALRSRCSGSTADDQGRSAEADRRADIAAATSATEAGTSTDAGTSSEAGAGATKARAAAAEAVAATLHFDRRVCGVEGRERRDVDERRGARGRGRHAEGQAGREHRHGEGCSQAAASEDGHVELRYLDGRTSVRADATVAPEVRQHLPAWAVKLCQITQRDASDKRPRRAENTSAPVTLHGRQAASASCAAQYRRRTATRSLRRHMPTRDRRRIFAASSLVPIANRGGRFFTRTVRREAEPGRGAVRGLADPFLDGLGLAPPPCASRRYDGSREK